MRLPKPLSFCRKTFLLVLNEGDFLSKENPEDEWVGMPEFVQEKKRPFKVLKVQFETEEDLQAFAKLIDQKLTEKTKTIWFPFKSHWGKTIDRWVDKE